MAKTTIAMIISLLNKVKQSDAVNFAPASSFLVKAIVLFKGTQLANLFNPNGNSLIGKIAPDVKFITNIKILINKLRSVVIKLILPMNKLNDKEAIIPNIKQQTVMIISRQLKVILKNTVAKMIGTKTVNNPSIIEEKLLKLMV